MLDLNMKRKYEVLRELNQRIPFKEADYFNMVFATGIAKGVKFTEDKIKDILLNGIEDKFITYGEALSLFKVYKNILME